MKFLIRYKYFILFFLLVIFWLVRIPGFKVGWDYQDSNGADVDIFVNQPSSPNFLLEARLNGKEIYVPAYGHPGTIYELFALNGKAAEAVVPINTMSDQQVATFLKIMVTFMQMLVFAGLGWYILKKYQSAGKQFLAFIILAVLASAPIVMYGSNEFQIDSYLGVMMTASLCFAVLPFLETHQRPRKWHYVLLALAAAFLGLGKNEWSLILITAVIGVLALYFIVNKLILKRPVDRVLVSMLITILVGNVFGNLANIIFSKDLYFSGIELLLRMTRNASVNGNAGQSWFSVMVSRLPYISTIIVLLVALFWMVLRKVRELDYYRLFIFIYGFGLFFAFFLSSWGDFPRYFAPGLMVLTFAFFLYLRDFKPDLILDLALIALIIVVGFNSFNLFNSLKDRSKHDTYFNVTAATDNCVPLIDEGIVFRRPEIDFVHLGWGRAAAETIVAPYGKHMCN